MHCFWSALLTAVVSPAVHWISHGVCPPTGLFALTSYFNENVHEADSIHTKENMPM